MTTLTTLCLRRGCTHFGGFNGETPICLAYPLGIPQDIQAGLDLHLAPRPDDDGFQFKEPEALKHLAGRHAQKRHGWRYGAGQQRQMDDAGEQAVYDARATVRGLGRQAAAAANQRIADLRTGFIQARQANDAAANESNALSVEYLRLTQARNDAMQANTDINARSNQISDRLYEIDEILHGPQRVRWGTDEAAKLANRAEKAAWREANPKEVAKLYREDAKLQKERTKVLKQAQKAWKAQEEANKAFNEFNDGPQGQKMRDFWKLHGETRRAMWEAEKAAVDASAGDRAVALKAGMRQAAVLRKSVLRSIPRLDARFESTMKEMTAASDAYWGFLAGKDYKNYQDLPEFKKLDAAFQRATDAHQKAANARSRMTHLALVTKQAGGTTVDFANKGHDFDGPALESTRTGFDIFNKLVGRQTLMELSPVKVNPLEAGRVRAYCNGDQISLRTNAHNTTTAIHELGHALEDRDPFIASEVRSFYTRRVKNGPVRSLNDLLRETADSPVSYRVYDDNEVGIRDKFIDEYMGKLYGSVDKPAATEILSMGLQMFYENPTRLMRQDPEYFDFIYAVVRMGGVDAVGKEFSEKHLQGAHNQQSHGQRAPWKTGEPAEITVYKGISLRGPADPGDLGVGAYYSTDEATAKSYGTVTKSTVRLQNPLVMGGGRAVGFVRRYKTLRGSLEQRTAASMRLTASLQAKGYDGLIVSGYDSPPGAFTVVVFPKATQKHLRGQHDQARHGHRFAGGAQAPVAATVGQVAKPGKVAGLSAKAQQAYVALAAVEAEFGERKAALGAELDTINARLHQLNIVDETISVEQRWAENAERSQLYKRSEVLVKEKNAADQEFAFRCLDAIKVSNPATIDVFYDGVSAKRQKEVGDFVQRIGQVIPASKFPKADVGGVYKNNPGVEIVGKSNRAQYNGRGQIDYKTGGVVALAHEMGHWVEDLGGNWQSGQIKHPLRERTRQFLEKRTAGEKLRRLPNTKNEFAKFDKFLDPYMGKTYQWGDTEILSMGLQTLITKPTQFAQQDGEYFSLVIDILQGEP